MSAPANKLAANRKAFRDFTILERVEAGIELLGTEVKSVRGGQVTLTGGYAVVQAGQVFLHDVHIQPYEQGNRFNHEPTRTRRLLLRKKEILKLGLQTARKGFALVPLDMHLKRGLIKVELGLCRGKTDPDKRDDLRRKTDERETQRAIASTKGA